MTPYRVGIVGLTGIAAAPEPANPIAAFGTEAPHSHAASYAGVAETQVVAVCELVPKLIDDFRANWGATWPGVTGYSDYRQMLARERLDILSVVTSDHRHADIVVDAVAAGVKGIYCEKPIATTLADADRMIAAVEAGKVPMIVNHSRRWYPEYHAVRQLVRSGELGRLSRVVACCGYGRAMLFRNGTHLLDSVNMFAESDPQWVLAELDPGMERYGAAYAGDGGRNPATDPGATALIRYSNGVLAFFCMSKTTAVTWEIWLQCERGNVRLTPSAIGVSKLSGEPAELLSKRLPPPHTQWRDGVAAVRELIGLIEHGGGEGQCPPREARKALEIILAILRSQALGNVKVDLPLG